VLNFGRGPVPESTATVEVIDDSKLDQELDELDGVPPQRR
jgi:hypothetical protein